MSDKFNVVRSLLAAARALGGGAEADAFQRSFEARVDLIEDVEIRALRVLVARLATGEEPEEPSDLPSAPPPPAETLTSGDDEPLRGAGGDKATKRVTQADPIEHFAVFVRAMPDGDRLVEALSDLMSLDTFDVLLQKIEAIFCGIFGFDRKRIDLTSRLGSQRTFSKFFAIAEYGGFVVSAVEITSDVLFTSPYAPVAATYPFGLCFAVNERRRSLRVVFTENDESGIRTPRFRTLMGQRHRDEPRDNLLTFAWRLSHLRPEFRDTKSSIRDRVTRLLQLPSDEVAIEWGSDVLSSPEVPGPTWEELPALESASFLQQHCAPRRHWGLERALRDRFPILIQRGDAELGYVGYDCIERVMGEIEGKSGVSLVLHTRLVFADARPAISIPIPAFLALPQADGAFLIEGARCEFLPSSSATGALRIIQEVPDGAGDDTDVDDDELLEDAATVDLDVDRDGDAMHVRARGSVEDGDTLETREEVEPSSAVGGSLCALLEIAVARKLAAISAALFRHSLNGDLDESTVVSALYAFADERGRLELCSIPFLHGALTTRPFTTGGAPLRPVPSDEPDVVSPPPAWACSATSGTLGHSLLYFPIASARLHPSGAIAVPHFRDAWRLAAIDTDAFDANPRHNASIPAGNPSWWVSALLAAWSTTRINLGAALTPFATSRVCQKVHSFAREWSNVPSICDSGVVLVREQTANRLTLSSISTRRFVFDIPAAADAAGSMPELLIAQGEVAAADRAWLTVPPDCWAQVEPPKWPRVLTALAHIADRPLPKTPRFFVPLPSSAVGRVARSSLTPTYGRNGTQVGWRAVLEVTEQARLAAAITPAGRLLPVRVAADEEFPFDDRGEPIADIVVYDRSAIDLTVRSSERRTVIDGATGEPIEVARGDGTFMWFADGSRTDADSRIPRRLIDGQFIARPWAPAFTEQERLWQRIVQPSLANELDRCERYGRVPPWSTTLDAISKLTGANGPPQSQGLEESNRHDSRTGGGARRSRFDPTIHLNDDFTLREDALGLAQWSCDCGELQGKQFVRNTCVECGTTVQLAAPKHATQVADDASSKGSAVSRLTAAVRPFASVGESISLPFKVIHPWRRSVVAALLGLTEDELLELAELHRPEVILHSAECAAGESPKHALSVRLDRERQRPARRELGRLMLGIEEWLAAGRPPLSLERIPIIPPRFLFLGRLPGGSRFTHGMLVERGRALLLAGDMAYRLSEGTAGGVLSMGWVELQRAVDALFGDLAATSEAIDDYAALLRRLWPLARRRTLPSSSPIIALRLGRRVLTSESLDIRRTSESVDIEWGTDCFGADFGSKYSRIDWVSAAARRRVSGRYAPFLVGLFCGLSKCASEHDSSAWCAMAGVPDLDAAVAIALQELAFAVGTRVGSAEALLRILEAPQIIRLPGSESAANARLFELLEPVLQSTSTAAELAKFMLTACFARWWQGPVSASCPLGWMRLEHSEPERGAFTRTIPDSRSGAWRLWPGMGACVGAQSWVVDGVGPSRILDAVLGRTEFSILQETESHWHSLRNQRLIALEYSTRSDAQVDDSHPAPQTFPQGVEPLKQISPTVTGLDSATHEDSGAVATIAVLNGSLLDWIAPKPPRLAAPERRGIARSCRICGRPPGMHQCCSHCRTMASGDGDIERIFGFRKMVRRDGTTIHVPQPWCRSCRAIKPSTPENG